jgi:hypothetical protein
VGEVEREPAARFSTFLEKASVSRVNRRMLIRMVRFCRSTKLVLMFSGSANRPARR